MTRKEQREKRRWEILCAALDIFIRKGYAAAKIQDIARAAGMSVGLMFHYFESKEKLYEELIKLGISGPRSVLTGIQGKPLDFFETAAREVISYIEKEPFVAKMFVLMAAAQSNEAAPESVKTLLAEENAIALSAQKIEQGQKDGSIRAGNPVSLAVTFWGAVQGIAGMIAFNPGIPIPESEWVVDILRSKK